MAQMIHSDSELSTKLEPAAPAAQAGPSNTELVENTHAENGASPVLDGDLHSPERANVNAMREALETQQEMEVGKPIQEKEQELEKSTGGENAVEIDAKPGKQIIINIAGKRAAITSGMSDINGGIPSFKVNYKLNGKDGMKEFSSQAAAEQFMKGASAKFGSKLSFSSGYEGEKGDQLPEVCTKCHVRKGDDCQCEDGPTHPLFSGKEAFLSPQDAQRFREHNEGSNVALNQDEEGSRKWEPVFPEDARENSNFFKESDGDHIVKAVGMDAPGAAFYQCSCGKGATFSTASIKPGMKLVCDGKKLQWVPKTAGVSMNTDKKAGFNFFFPGQVLKEFYPEIQHEIVDYPNANNSPMGLETPEIGGNAGHELEGMLDDALGNTSVVEAISLPGDVGEIESHHHAGDYVSTSPAAAAGIGRDGKPEVLEGVPLRKENDIRGLMFTDEFYGQYEGVPGAMLQMASVAESKTATEGAEKDQFAEFIQLVCGEIAAALVGAFKVTQRPLLDQVPGVGEVQLANVEQQAGIGTGIMATNSIASSRVKYLMDKLNDGDIKDAINSGEAQAAVWCKGTRGGGFVYEVFVRAESIDTDSMIMKYKFVCGTKE